MTRTPVVLTALVFTVMPAFGRPAAAPKPMMQNRVLLDLSGIHLFHPQPITPSTPLAGSDAQSGAWHPLSLPKFAVGPLHAELGMDDNPRANLSTYKLQGADQLGSSVWQAEQGKSAKLLFTWPTDK